MVASGDALLNRALSVSSFAQLHSDSASPGVWQEKNRFPGAPWCRRFKFVDAAVRLALLIAV